MRKLEITSLFLAVLLISLTATSCSGDKRTSKTTADTSSINANLSQIALSHGALNPPFSSSVTSYTALFIGDANIQLTPHAEEVGSAIKVNGDIIPSGTPSSAIALAPGKNTITVSVTAPNGSTTKTYTITAVRITQEAYIKSSNTGTISSSSTGTAGTSGLFGYSISLSGDTLAVGAYGESSNATGINGNQADDSAQSSGAVYVFTRTGTTWAQQAYIKASNTGTNDYFGYSVSLSGDTLAVGAYGESSNATGINGNQADDSALGSGAVYVFTRTGTTWAQQAYIKASNTGTIDYFGNSVSLSGDTLAVGACGESSNATGINGNQADDSALGSGAVYVLTRTGTTWAQQAYIKASNAGADDAFGRSVSLLGDTLAVGAWGESSNATGINGNQADDSAQSSGAVYVFTRTGTTWAQQAYIKASNAGTNDWFGYSVSLSGDTLAVGAWGESSNATGINGNQADDSALGSGAVYVIR